MKCKTFIIVNDITGQTLGRYVSVGKEAALDCMARLAGYENYAEACKVAPVKTGEIVVYDVSEINWLA